MKVSKIFATLGLAIFFLAFLLGEQVIPYQTGIGLSLFLLALILGVVIRAKQHFLSSDVTKRKPTVGMWILAGGIVFGLFCWINSGSSKGLDGFVVIYAYAAILIGGLMVIFKK